MQKFKKVKTMLYYLYKNLDKVMIIATTHGYFFTICMGR